MKWGTLRESTKSNTKHRLFTQGWNAALIMLGNMLFFFF